MKSKKTFFGFGILALLLVLGVGYAVVSSVPLTINGKVSANSDIKVSFESVKSKSNNSTVTAETTSGSQTATFNVSDLATVGQTEYAIYTIKNEESDVRAKISLDGTISPSDKTYFDVKTDLVDGTVIEPNSTLDVKVSVTLVSTPLTAATSEANVSIKLKAEAVTN